MLCVLRVPFCVCFLLCYVDFIVLCVYCVSLKCLKTKGNLGFSRVREGPGTQVRATLAPKSRPKWLRTAQSGLRRPARGDRRGQDGKNWAGQVGLAVRVVEPGGNQPQCGSRRRQNLSKRQVI